MSFHESILTATQVQVLRSLAPIVNDARFYLAGGTALALWCGHRRSEDFDWFGTALERPDDLLSETRARGVVLDGVQVDAGTLAGQVEGVKVSFFEYRYPLLEPLAPWADYGVNIASITDIAAMKLLAIAQRGARKDFVDVYELIRQGRTLQTLLDNFAAKFQTDPFSVLKGLTYFDDAETEPMPVMLNGVEWNAVRRDVTRAVREVVP